MTKRGMRGFAAGLWLAAVVMAYFHFTGHETEKTGAEPGEVTQEQVQHFLKDQNEVAVSKEDYNTLKSPTDQNSNKNDKQDGKTDQKKKQQNNEKKSTHNTKLKIKKGMTSQEVAEQLEDAKVIKDAEKLQDYLGDHGIEENVQLGSYKLSSDMSLKKIAKKITS